VSAADRQNHQRFCRQISQANADRGLGSRSPIINRNIRNPMFHTPCYRRLFLANRSGSWRVRLGMGDKNLAERSAMFIDHARAEICRPDEVFVRSAPANHRPFPAGSSHAQRPGNLRRFGLCRGKKRDVVAATHQAFGGLPCGIRARASATRRRHRSRRWQTTAEALATPCHNSPGFRPLKVETRVRRRIAGVGACVLAGPPGSSSDADVQRADHAVPCVASAGADRPDSDDSRRPSHLSTPVPIPSAQQR